jgi:hypothetical protein
VGQADLDSLAADHDGSADGDPPGDDEGAGRWGGWTVPGRAPRSRGRASGGTGQATVRTRTPPARMWATGPSSRRVTRCPVSGSPALMMWSPRLTLPEAFTVRSARQRGIAKPRGERVDLDAMTARARAGTAGDAPYSWAALGRDLRCGSPPVAARRRSAPPHPQAGGSAGNAPPVAAPRELGRAVLHAPGILSLRKGHSQERSLRSRRYPMSLPRWRYAPPLSVIFLGKTSAPIRRTGEDRNLPRCVP